MMAGSDYLGLLLVAGLCIGILWITYEIKKKR